MLTRRLIACFDVLGGKVTKARQFQDNIEVGDAAEVAVAMYEDQIDEIIFYDITASAERRPLDLDTVKAVAANVFVPLTVGGGHPVAGRHAPGAGRRGREGEHRLDGGPPTRRSSRRARRSSAGSAWCSAPRSSGCR